MINKKKSSRIKGDTLEKEIKETLLRIFPFVEGPPIKTRFARRDYFTLFDFIVLDDYDQMIGIQVSTRKIYDKGREFKDKWNAWPGKKVFAISSENLIEELQKLNNN